jgi:hypothetical protein
MTSLYDQTLLAKLERAIEDLSGGSASPQCASQRQKLIQFLQTALEECRAFNRADDVRPR